MSKFDEYSRAAEDCSKMAQTATTEAEKWAWLKISDSWLRLAKTVERQALLALSPVDTGENPTPVEPQRAPALT